MGNPGNQRDYEPVHFWLAVLPEPKNVFRIWQTKGGGIPQGILYAPDTEEVPSWYHRVQLDNDWYYYWIPG